MNLVLDEAEEVLVKGDKSRRPLGKLYIASSTGWDWYILVLGRIMLKGDNITLIQPVNSPA